jgi:hypothetical protein
MASGKNPIKGLGRSEGLQKVEAPSRQSAQESGKLSALPTDRLYSPGNIPGTQFCQRLSQPQDHSAAGRIMSMKNSNDTIGNRTRDLPACSAVPQPTVPPRANSFLIVPEKSQNSQLTVFRTIQMDKKSKLHIVRTKS